MAGGRRPGAGRPAGSVNKATSAARKAIGMFVDANSKRLQGWLDDVANGRKGMVSVYDAKQKKDVLKEVWIVKPDPLAATQVLQGLVEYHVPKLARTEVTGKDGRDLVPPQIKVVGVRAKR